MYREHRPPPDLVPLVECFWIHRLTAEDGDRTGVVLPDGRVDVVWTKDGRTLVAGPQKRAVARPVTPPFIAVGARFRPGVGPPLLGVAAHELVDLQVPLEQLGTARAGVLSRMLPAAPGAEGAAADLAAGLRELAARAEPPDPEVGAASALLAQPGERVETVAAAVSLSDRQLRRRFRESVGYGPKTLHRVLRFTRLLEALAGEPEPEGDLAGIAFAAGYSDQAHMTRETRELTALTPLELTRLWRA